MLENYFKTSIAQLNKQITKLIHIYKKLNE